MASKKTTTPPKGEEQNFRCKFGGFCYVQKDGKCSKCRTEPKAEVLGASGPAFDEKSFKVKKQKIKKAKK